MRGKGAQLAGQAGGSSSIGRKFRIEITPSYVFLNVRFYSRQAANLVSGQMTFPHDLGKVLRRIRRIKLCSPYLIVGS